ncbi:lamin tail domain-containing protein [Paractinoplanes atraurantiacus]|uniref:Lamin Tail Domain n=1 Tax=Paractinoplanes atraurantiacus TaxID=1036182 RepID=A0A285F5R5_9ACTN|nr:lamin tail domain-containing protein [Actinoplanes atraurantiacus]SNY06612.1 Lamin Tail Domain [Actinoplanes atraurantiacus]
MISRLVSKATVAAIGAVIAVAAPASAAGVPTLQASAPVIVGYKPVTLSGVAEAGAQVQLYETAIGWNDMQPAQNWTTGGTVVATADASGRFSFSRWVDSGFLFEVHQGSAVSNRVTVYSRLEVGLSGGSTVAGRADLTAWNVPGQGGLPYQFQLKQANGTWKTVFSGKGSSDADGAFLNAKISGLAPGSLQTFRAYVGGDTSQGLQGNYSKELKITVKAAAPVQFTKIRYDSTGADTGSNASLNAEWVKLTNKTKTRINLNGWTLRDAQSIVYKFSGTVYLNAGASIFVQSGKGTNTATHRFWGRAGKSGYVWNNGGDTAQLRTPANVIVDACKWAIVGTGETNC